MIVSIELITLGNIVDSNSKNSDLGVQPTRLGTRPTLLGKSRWIPIILDIHCKCTREVLLSRVVISEYQTGDRWE